MSAAFGAIALTNPGAAILRIWNGKVSEDVGCMDWYSMFHQLGVLPSLDRIAETQPVPAPAETPPHQDLVVPSGLQSIRGADVAFLGFMRV